MHTKTKAMMGKSLSLNIIPWTYERGPIMGDIHLYKGLSHELVNL